MDIVIIDGLSFALPLFIMAIGGIYCEKSGVTMLAVEGLQGFGAFIGAFVAVAIAGNFAGDSPAPFYIAMIMAAVGGSLFALIHAMLCLKFKANQVISGVVVNILAMALTAYLTKLFNRVVFGATSDKFVLTVSSRITIPGISKIPVLGAVFTNLYPFELVIVVVAFVAWFVMYKTRFGMHLRACGDNPHAVDAAGRQVGQIRLAAIMICGALSGLGGICFAYYISANFSSSIYVGYGYLAIAALIFGNAGFIGIPIIMALWPHEGAIYVALMSIVDQTLLWTYGVWLCEPVPEPGTVASPDAAGRPTLGLRVRNLLGRFVNPAFIGVMLALVLTMLGVRIPSIVLTPLRTIGGMATPMSLIYLGGLFALTKWWGVLILYVLYVGLVAMMIAFPLGLYALLTAAAGALPELPITHDMIMMITLVAGLPTMTTIAMFTARRNNMPDYAVGFVLVSTLFSLLSLTIVSAVVF